MSGVLDLYGLASFFKKKSRSRSIKNTSRKKETERIQFKENTERKNHDSSRMQQERIRKEKS